MKKFSCNRHDCEAHSKYHPRTQAQYQCKGNYSRYFYPPTIIDIQPHDIMGYNEEQLPIILVEFVKYTCHAMTQAIIEAGQNK